MADSDLNKKIEYFDNLKTKREKWHHIWDELKKYVCPQTETNKVIFDSTSIWSREQLASGLQSLLVNPAMNWFNLTIVAENDEQQQYLTTAERNMLAQMLEKTLMDIFNNPASNFYSQIHQFFLNLSAFGTAIFYVEEDLELAQTLFFRNINLQECYFEEDKFGFVNTMYRLFSMPIKSASAKWVDFAPFKERLARNPDEIVEILHIVSPQAQNQKSKGRRAMVTASPSTSSSSLLPYSSEYIYLAEQKIISQSGYSYFPFFVTRWVKEEGEVYGYAPAHHVLPDIKLLNSLRQITLKVAQKQLDPPLLVPKDGYYLPLYTTPGSVNFYRNGMADKIMPLTGMENILPTEIEQNQCRDAIFKAFYVDIFRMQKENKEMTATEVQIRTEEQYRLMSPMVGRIESELLNPLIMAIYQTLIKYNRVPILEGANSPPEIEIGYVSPLSRVQKTSAIASVEQVLGFFQRSGISNFFPEIYDNINWDECFKLFFELREAPSSILKSEQEVLQIRQQRKMMQMQQLQQQQQIQG
ncbi:portal protein [Candidatus Tisiphia endosymbiont of Melanophora roralis]|uniref:portal protein n=1 Tax=Candidatus Tisiphia endosymbiont of Melanophora roralis TaxID=3066261 RepID=UPI00312C87CC